MRAVVQRVTRASVSVDGAIVGAIDGGLMVLLGVHRDDTDADAAALADKIAHLRVFSDADGKLNRDVIEAGGAVLLVSQFTLCGDARKGRRPSYVTAAGPEEADRLYREVGRRLRSAGLTVAEGIFRASMFVELVNDGPVTILLDSHRVF